MIARHPASTRPLLALVAVLLGPAAFATSFIGAFLVALLVGGCGAPPRGAESLSDSVRSFNDGVRWERFALAAARVPPAERSQFVDEMDERAGELKITDYEIVTVDARGPQRARVHVKLSWYRPAEGTLRETHALQTWERRGAAWMMVGEARVRGAAMPGLPEPALDAGEEAAPPEGGSPPAPRSR